MGAEEYHAGLGWAFIIIVFLGMLGLVAYGIMV